MSHRVEIAETQQVFMVAPGESVLDAALRCGVALAHECTFGGCGTCRVRVVEGSVSYEDFPMGLSEAEAADGFALACQARPEGDIVISTARASEPLVPARRTTAIVQSVAPLGPDVLHLRLDLPEGDAPFAFEPGQYLKVLLEDGSHRSFSMASAPRGNAVDFHVRQIAGGRFTSQQLPQLRAGDRLDVELPHGSFSLRKEDYRPLLMVATGTGLAPIKSMLESLMDDPDCPPVWLYWGMRAAGDLYLHDEIASWGERLYDFQYVPVLSRADERWQGRRGYVHDAVAADLGDLSEHAIYLCGSPNMIRDAKQTFMALGAQAPFVYADGFTFQHAGG